MKRLRAGIIGLGVGEQHISGYQRHSDCEVVALCDFSDEKLAMVGEKYPGLKLTSKADDILEDPEINVVSIASYDNYHYEQVEKGIRNNKHLFVEKPLCLYEWQAEQIRNLLHDRPGLRLSSNLILRMCPRFRLLKGMIQEGTFGQLFYIEGDYNYGRLSKITEGWRGEIDFYSVVYGGAVHIVDLLLWLTGDTVEEVVAYGNHIASAGTAFRYNDFVAGLLRFRSGMLAKVSANFGCMMPHYHSLTLYGTKATFMNGPQEGALFTSRDPNSSQQAITADYPGVQKGDLIYSFVQSILGEAPALVTKEDVFRTMSVCFAIEAAMQQQRAVSVRYI